MTTIHTDCGNCGHPIRRHTRRRANRDNQWGDLTYDKGCALCDCPDVCYVAADQPLFAHEPELRPR